jgi:hypothetical protein
MARQQKKKVGSKQQAVKDFRAYCILSVALADS